MKGFHEGSSFIVGSRFEYGQTPKTSSKVRTKRKVSWGKLQVAFFSILLISVLTTFLVSFNVPKLDQFDIHLGLTTNLRVALETLIRRPKQVSRIAFGSAPPKEEGPQPIWSNAIARSLPDVWIWVGDSAYLEEPSVSCEDFRKHPQCNCDPNWLRHSSCLTGNVSHARLRFQQQLLNPDYAKFLEHACPGHKSPTGVAPPGSDPRVCHVTQIFGTYDDRDFGWVQGNRLFPFKDEIKNLFLDFLGEPRDSPRRRRFRGIEQKHTLNPGHPQRSMDLVIVDPRYYRDPLPCQMRRELCRRSVLRNVEHRLFSWCQHFLRGNGSQGSHGSCCQKDERLFLEWCQSPLHRNDSLWREACDPSWAYFGARALSLSPRGDLREDVPQEWDGEGDSTVPPPVPSPYCEVLGRAQREWLEAELLSSRAPLKLLVSASPLLGNPRPQPCMEPANGSLPPGAPQCPCSGDDWECYSPAQQHMLQLIARSPGCVIVLSGGGTGFADIKVVRPGAQPYERHYRSSSLPKPIFQVTSGGLAAVRGGNYTCRRGGGDLASDPMGTRENLECDFLPSPSFGFIQIDWELSDPLVHLQIRDGKTGESKFESQFSLSQCGESGAL